MKSRNKTTLAVLRSIMDYHGEDVVFAKTVGLSKSWIVKASAGITPITTKAAMKIARATGIDLQWLLANDPTKAPKSQWDKKYTIEEFNHWRAFWCCHHEDGAIIDIPIFLESIIASCQSAITKKKHAELFQEVQAFQVRLLNKFGENREDTTIIDRLLIEIAEKSGVAA
jgi:transcriptional regulator with XRE-family HTH domain